MMKLKDVKDRFSKIAAVGYDPEVTHPMEDDLYRDVLTAIAGGAPDAAKLAAAALRTQELDLTRWHA